MTRNTGTDKAFEVLRELPTEVSLEQVGHMVAAFPLVAPGASWLSHLKPDPIIMISAVTLIVGASVFLFRPSGQTPPVVRTNLVVPTMEPSVPPAPHVVEPSALTYPAKEPQAAVVVPKEVKKKPAPRSAPGPAGEVVASLAPVAMMVPTPKPQPIPTPQLMTMTAATAGREFDLNGFTAVTVLGFMDVLIEQGDFAVRADGDEGLVAALQLSVKGKELVIAIKDENGGWKQEMWGKDRTVNVHVYMPQMERMELNGSGDVYAKNFTATTPVEIRLSGSGEMHINSFKGLSAMNVKVDGSGDVVGEGIAVAGRTKIELNGSGDVVMEGSTEDLEVSVVGSGDVNAGAMKARTCRVNVKGSGDVVVHCSAGADSKISGSGTINNIGNGGRNGATGVEDRSY